MLYVGVVGPGAVDEQQSALCEDARAVGRALAEARAIVVCGGLGGVMAAVSEGVAERDGQCVGLLPGDDRSAANDSLSVALPTGAGEGRNWLIVCASDVVIAIGGGYGTLSEIALALRAGRHVVGLRTWPIAEQDALMHTARSASDAVTTALRLAAA
ncbi:MAG: hypothetical protein QOF54_1463 [Solirubrobacteraceae bacterium]|jgi:uncharacterized protein (TIGR00725 family)|nr:hypothetical protein [Solirubrobacteraceae bacterium]